MSRASAAGRAPRRAAVLGLGAILVGAALVAGRLAVGALATPPIRVGAVFPLHGAAGSLAADELAGVRIAIELANGEGGIGGRAVELDLRELASRDDAPGVMAGLARDGVPVVIGAYSSDLSVAASAAADAAGLVYWEAGAVADQLTGRGLPRVFRVGASGTNLGANSVAFAASELAPRLGRAPSDLRLAIVSAQDAYAASVADAAEAAAAAHGLPVVARPTYNLAQPDWDAVMAALAAARPDVIVLASHIPDGVAFRRAMLAAKLHVGALIGSTMAECDPDFAGDLGADAVGVFASDRPTGGFRPDALDGEARAAYDAFARAWAGEGVGASPRSGGAGTLPTGAGTPAPSNETGSGDGYGTWAISGPDDAPGAEATEEALAGFSAAWALLHDVLPAAGPGSLDAGRIAAAARALDLPAGSLPNGAGLRFSSDPATLGQNTRAAAVIWQWQAVRTYQFVWPVSYATAPIAFVPLAR